MWLAPENKEDFYMMRIKRIRNIVIMGALAITFIGSAFKAVKANGTARDFSVNTYAYYTKDYDVTDFYHKDTDDSVYINVMAGTYQLDYKVLGSNDEDGNDYADCSNGYRYRIGESGTADMYNWVNEWGYSYAGLMAEAVVDYDTWQKGYFITY